MQHKETNKKTRINYEQGQHVTYAWAPAKEGEAVNETEDVERQSLRDLGHGEGVSTGSHPAGARAVSPHEGDQQQDK